MLITTKAQHQEITATVQQLRTERALVKVADAVKTTGRPARYATGLPAARHHVSTERMLTRPAPRTVRTTHDGRRVVQRRTGRLA